MAGLCWRLWDGLCCWLRFGLRFGEVINAGTEYFLVTLITPDRAGRDLAATTFAQVSEKCSYKSSQLDVSRANS
jgi:hypothetical protein